MKVWNLFSSGAANRKSMILTPSSPGAFGDGYFLKYSDAARLGPIPSGSIAATCAGERPYQPALIGCDELNPCTEPPGQSPGLAHRYISTPSRSESDGTDRVTGRSLFSCSPS